MPLQFENNASGGGGTVISGTPNYLAMFNGAGDNVEDSNTEQIVTGAESVLWFKSPDGVNSAILSVNNDSDLNGFSLPFNSGAITMHNPGGVNQIYVGESAHYGMFFSDSNNNYAGIELYWEDGLGDDSLAKIINNNGLFINGGEGVFLKWPLSDGSAGEVIKTDGAGNLDFNYPFIALGNIPFLEYSFVGGIFEDLPSGINDLYTVPAGKKAVVLETQGLYNNTAGSVTSNSLLKISGNYYRIGLAVSQGANSGGNITFNNSILLNAGESYSINTGSTGQSVFLSIVEFSEDIPIKRIGSTGLGSGDNTIYTVPANKKAFFTTLSSPGKDAGGYIRAVNVSGGAVTITPYSIESGQAKAAKYQNQAATAVSNNAQALFAISPQLNTGDFILFNSTSAASGQIIFGTVIEIEI